MSTESKMNVMYCPLKVSCQQNGLNAVRIIVVSKCLEHERVCIYYIMYTYTCMV